MAIIARSVSMPERVFEDIDSVAEAMNTNRSQLLVRVWQEWRQVEATKQARKQRQAAKAQPEAKAA